MGSTEAVHTDIEHRMFVRKLAAEGSGNWRRAFDWIRLRNLGIG